jgi:hypothetical protein
MPGPKTLFDAQAQEAAERIDAARAAGQQLTFLPDEAGAPGQGSRPPRGKGKATSQMREWLAARGFRMPEDALAEMAALASGDDAFVTAMARTEQVLAWAVAGATSVKGQPAVQTMAQRLATFQFVYTAQLRAAEALLPYGLAKVTPDEAPQVPVQIVVQGGATVRQGPDQARDVTPGPRRMAPPPMPSEMQRFQGVADAVPNHADGEARTE